MSDCPCLDCRSVEDGYLAARPVDPVKNYYTVLKPQRHVRFIADDSEAA